MPSFARNVVALLAFQPGVTSFSSGGTVGSNDGAVNGGKPDQGNVTLDGADVNDQNARAAFTSVLARHARFGRGVSHHHHQRRRGHRARFGRGRPAGHQVRHQHVFMVRCTNTAAERKPPPIHFSIIRTASRSPRCWSTYSADPPAARSKRTSCSTSSTMKAGATPAPTARIEPFPRANLRPGNCRLSEHLRCRP